jgi:hypothetical protein
MPEHPEYALSQPAQHKVVPILALQCALATVSSPNFAWESVSLPRRVSARADFGLLGMARGMTMF